MLTLTFEDRAYKVEPKFEMVCEIEDELGSLIELNNKFSRDSWSVCELVTIVHIVLQYCGRSVDYMELGNKILEDGIGTYLAFANKFLNSLIYK